jgi:uncharacterized caspase-like protein
MNLANLGISRRTIALGAAVFAGLVSAGIGADAALNKLTPDQWGALQASGMSTGSIAVQPGRLALVVGNSGYPDAGAPLAQPINDARTLSTVLRNDGFDVDLIEDARRDDLVRAVARLKDKVKSDTVVMFYFGGYGVQSAGESFMIPVDATIWKESDVRRDGISIEWVLSEMKEHGARAKLVVVDASRRNPFERRFRNYSRGLAPINAGDNSLVLSSAPPDKVVDDSRAPNSLLVTELLDNMNSPAGTAERVFDRTRVSVSKATEGQQVPTVSSSLIEDVRLGSGPAHMSDSGS